MMLMILMDHVSEEGLASHDSVSMRMCPPLEVLIPYVIQLDYPGDEYVDWVGISLYWYPATGVNSVPYPASYIHDSLLGNGPYIVSVVDSTFNYQLHNFYDVRPILPKI